MGEKSLLSKILLFTFDSIASFFIESFFDIIISQSVKLNKKRRLKTILKAFCKKHIKNFDIKNEPLLKQEIENIFKIIKLYYYDLDNPMLPTMLNDIVSINDFSADAFFPAFIESVKDLKKYISNDDLSDINDQIKRDIFKSIKYQFMGHIDTYPENVKETISDRSFNIFDYRLIKTFKGREGEIKEIINFCSDNALFKWWLLTADGGVGKSKLLFEIKTKQNSYNLEKWKILFYDPIDFTEFNHLYYNRNLLLVIDYYAKNRTGTERLLRQIQRKNKSNKIRVLLIERKSFENLVDFDKSHFYGKNPLQIRRLSDKENKELAFEYLSEVIEDNPKKYHNADKELIVEKALSELNCDKQKRPLILLILLRYYLEETSGNIEDAFNKHINKYMNHLEYYFGDSEFLLDSKRLLVLSTIVGTFRININADINRGNSELECKILHSLIKHCKGDKERINNVCNSLNGTYAKDTDDLIFSKIEPDILGEAVVLNYWNAMQDPDFFYLLGSERYKQELFEFVIRLIDDMQFVKIYANYNSLYNFFNELFEYISIESFYEFVNGFDEAINNVLHKSSNNIDAIHRIFYLSILSYRILMKLMDFKKSYTISKPVIINFINISIKVCNETDNKISKSLNSCSQMEKGILLDFLKKTKETIQNIIRFEEAMK